MLALGGRQEVEDNASKASDGDRRIQLCMTLLVERQLFAQEQVFRCQLRSRPQSQPDKRDEVMQ
jgi:hypothetical protein